jgi:cellulose synthase/poly-beta-1,6-N-acetylglucosamine synthase-like glycosyltransferase
MQTLFWLSLFLIFYPYIVYPALVLLWGALRPREVRRAVIEPTVTILVPAYNEADCIANTVSRLIEQDYPRERLQILVVSDGSDDGTDDIVRGFADRGVELLRQEGRGGKAVALNAAVLHARGEIIVFCDANAQFSSDAVRQFVCNFADPEVGYVTGQLTLASPGETVSGSGSGAYIRYENMVRAAETRVASIIGVNGGVDAIRRSLYSDIPRELITDFVLPLRVIDSGYRVVYDPAVRSTEVANAELQSEFRMRVRVALRAVQGLVHMKRLLNPLRYPVTAFCLMSHKVLRYMGFVFLVTAALSNLWLAASSAMYLTLLIAHVACYGLALMGIARIGGGWVGRVALVPAYLLVSYAAFALATFKFLRGQTMATWQPRAG